MNTCLVKTTEVMILNLLHYVVLKSTKVIQDIGVFVSDNNSWRAHLSVRLQKANSVTASCCRSLDTLTEMEEPEEMGKSLGTGAHRHHISILPPGVKYVPRP